MKKLLIPLLVLAVVLAACGAPTSDPVTVEVTRIVEVEVPGDTVFVEVTPTLPAPTEPEEWGILYLQAVATNESGRIRLWTDTGLLNNAGYPIFVPSEPHVTYDDGEFILAYNGRGSSTDPDEAEYWLLPDGTLALAGPSFSNAQEFVCVLEGVATHVYDDPAGICSNGFERTALFPGRWRGDGGLYFYKVAGPDGAGMFVNADDVTIPSCDDLIGLKEPDSCNQ